MLNHTIKIAVATGALVLSSLSPGVAQDGRDLLLVGATVIDGTGEAAEADSWLHIRGDRIHAIGQGDPPAVRGAEVLELTGKTVLPGLGDMHVHLRRLENARWVLTALLAHGVTVVQETGNSLGSIAAIQRWIADQEAVPRYYPSSPSMQGSVADLRFLNAGGEVVRRTEDYAAFGLKFIKVYNFLSTMALAQLHEVAEPFGIRIIGHTPLSGTSVAAFDAGIEIMQHLRLRPQEVIDDLAVIAGYPIDQPLMKRTAFWAHFDPNGRNVRQTLDLWEERKDRIYVTPTLVAQKETAGSYDYPDPPSRFEQRPGADFLSERMLASWTGTDPMRWGRLSTGEVAEAQASFRGMAEFLRLAHERGIRILSGTDTSIPWVVPGVSLHEELQYFVEDSGMTPEQAIHTSTGRVAEALGTPDRGTIRAGHVADLVIVDGDVATDIRQLANVETVILGGRAYSHEQLMRDVARWAAMDTPDEDPVARVP